MLRFNQLHAADGFRRLIRSLSLRPSWLLAPRADRTAATHGRVAPRASTSGLSGRRVTPHACRMSLRRQTGDSAGGTSTRWNSNWSRCTSPLAFRTLSGARPGTAASGTPATRPAHSPVPSLPAPAVGKRQAPRHPRNPAPLSDPCGGRLRRPIRLPAPRSSRLPASRAGRASATRGRAASRGSCLSVADRAKGRVTKSAF